MTFEEYVALHTTKVTFDKYITSHATFDFHGVDGNKFKLNGMVWEAVEDPSDGYRSYLDSVQVRDGGEIFFAQPIAIVRIERVKMDNRDFEGYRLIDVFDGHVWLEFGTDHAENYYPCFTFRYTAKPTQVVDNIDYRACWQNLREYIKYLPAAAEDENVNYDSALLRCIQDAMDNFERDSATTVS